MDTIIIAPRIIVDLALAEEAPNWMVTDLVAIHEYLLDQEPPTPPTSCPTFAGELEIITEFDTFEPTHREIVRNAQASWRYSDGEVA